MKREPVDHQRTAARDEHDAGTGLPLLPTWRAVYAFVLAACLFYVAALAWLSRVFA